MHLCWVGNVYILILVLVGTPWLKASPSFQVNRIHTLEQLASNSHDALGVPDFHDATKSGRPYLSLETCLLSETPGNFFSCKSQHLSKLGSYHPDETINNEVT